MLAFLSIEDFALIDRLEMEFGPGLNLITGETGSGKSILVDAVGQVLGQRASSEMIRDRAQRARIEAVFRICRRHPARSHLEAAGIEVADEAIIRREISGSGSNKVFINGVLSTQGFLQEMGALLADIHGQHDDQNLLRTATHLHYLDAFSGNGTRLQEVGGLYRQLHALASQLDSIRRGEQERLRRIDSLQYQIKEIEALRLTPGLDEELARDKQLLSSAETRLQNSTRTYDLLYEDERSVLAQLDEVQHSLEELSRFDPAFSQTLEKLSEARFQLEEIAFELRDYADSVEFNPERLEAVGERLAELQRARRKYGDSVEEILAYGAAIRDEADTLAREGAQVDSLERQSERLQQQYLQAARELSERRRRQTDLLCARVESELADLAMQATVFEVSVSSDEAAPTGQGIDQVEFLISPNPGESPRPLAKIASGGELSRIILALKSILTLEEYPKTLVFDEVDSGIGGRVATALADKLKRLAGSHQVFCVTHLPQIAAAADHHYYVGKVHQQKRTRVRLQHLDEPARIEELARMLAGRKITPTTLQQARELLGQAAESAHR